MASMLNSSGVKVQKGSAGGGFDRGSKWSKKLIHITHCTHKKSELAIFTRELTNFYQRGIHILPESWPPFTRELPNFYQNFYKRANQLLPQRYPYFTRKLATFCQRAGHLLLENQSSFTIELATLYQRASYSCVKKTLLV